MTPPDFEHLPARLEAELAALGEAWYRPRDDELWSAAEVATMAEPGHEPEGFTPATGPAAHPRSWLLVRARLPACEALVEWLAAGGDPRDLGEPARQGLARADVLLEEMGLPATFRPHLRVVPIDAVVELGAEAREFFEGSRAPAGDGVDGEPGSRRCPPWRPGSTCQPRRSGWEAALARGAGWAGAAVTWVEAAALEARRAEQALLQAAFERREARGLFWDGALAPTVRDVVQRQVLADTFTRSPREVIQEFPLEFLPYDADLERRYGRWLTPLTEALVSAFAALARVADGGDPNEGPAAALAAMHLGSALRHSFVGAWYRLDPVQVLAARARTPYGHFVRAQLLDRGGRYQATPDAARRLAVLREFEAAAADPGPSAGRYARDFQRMVRMGLTATRLKLGRLQEMLDAFPALRADLQGESAAVLADAFTRTAVAMVLAGRTGPAAPEDLRALLAVMQQDPAPSATYRTVRREVEALRESVGPHDLVAPTRPEVLAFLRRAATR